MGEEEEIEGVVEEEEEDVEEEGTRNNVVNGVCKRCSLYLCAFKCRSICMCMYRSIPVLVSVFAYICISLCLYMRQRHVLR